MEFPVASYLRIFAPGLCPDHGGAPDAPLTDLLDELCYDMVTRVQCMTRTVGLNGTLPTIFFYCKAATDMPADTGANCRVTGNLAVVTNVRKHPAG